MRPILAMLIAIPLIAAGCVSAPEEIESASANEASAAAGAVAEPISLDGSLGASLFACAAVACQGQTIVPSDRIFETAAEGTNEVALTMEWSATDPRMEELLFGVFTCDPEACSSDAELSQIEYVSGTSPLIIELAGFDVPEGETMSIFVNAMPAVSGGPAFVLVTTPQGFHIEGEIVPTMEASA